MLRELVLALVGLLLPALVAFGVRSRRARGAHIVPQTPVAAPPPTCGWCAQEWHDLCEAPCGCLLDCAPERERSIGAHVPAVTDAVLKPTSPPDAIGRPWRSR